MYQNDPCKVLTGEVRLGYVNLSSPVAPGRDASGQPAGDPVYSCTLYIPKTDTATVADIRSAIQAAGDQARTARWSGKMVPNLDSILHDGDGVNKNGDPYGPEAHGCWVLAVKRRAKNGKPQVVMLPNIQVELDPRDVYSGMYARVTVSFFGYSNPNGRGITATLGNVLKTRDGEPLTGGRAAASDFAGLEGAINPITGEPMI